MSILIKNGRVVTAVDDYYADIFIDGETIAQIGKDLQVQADEVIDANGVPVVMGRNVEVDDDRLGFIASDELNPAKARILLMLALLEDRDLAALQQLYYEY